MSSRLCDEQMLQNGLKTLPCTSLPVCCDSASRLVQHYIPLANTNMWTAGVLKKCLRMFKKHHQDLQSYFCMPSLGGEFGVINYWCHTLPPAWYTLPLLPALLWICIINGEVHRFFFVFPEKGLLPSMPTFPVVSSYRVVVTKCQASVGLIFRHATRISKGQKGLPTASALRQRWGEVSIWFCSPLLDHSRPVAWTVTA